MYTKPDNRPAVTAGQIRSLLDSIPATAPVLVGIHDRRHVNTLLGELTVVGVAIMPSGGGRALVLYVETIS